LVPHGFLAINGVCRVMSEKLHQTFVADLRFRCSVRIVSSGASDMQSEAQLAFVDLSVTLCESSTDETEITRPPARTRAQVTELRTTGN
jgi:hypothetical protein